MDFFVGLDGRVLGWKLMDQYTGGFFGCIVLSQSVKKWGLSSYKNHTIILAYQISWEHGQCGGII